MIKQLKDGSWKCDRRKITRASGENPQILLIRDAVEIGDVYSVTVGPGGKKIILEKVDD